MSDPLAHKERGWVSKEESSKAIMCCALLGDKHGMLLGEEAGKCNAKCSTLPLPKLRD